MGTPLWRENNKAKLRKYRRDWYGKNKTHAKARVVARRTMLKGWFREMKNTLACECGETFWACLDFHHIDPKLKINSLSAAVHAGWGKEKILAEVAKCGVLCANCHRKETFG